MSNLRLAPVATAALAGLAPVAAAAQTRADGYYWHHPYMMGGAGWLAMLVGSIFMIVPLAVLIALAVLVARWAGGPRRTGERPPERTALDILKERFARGEIEKEEYDERRRVLGE